MANFKACPNCGTHRPPTDLFCTTCGASIAETPVQSLYGGNEHYWTIPDYLQQASRWQRARDSGAAGSGLAWLGAVLVVVPFVTEPERNLSLGAFAAGLTLIVAGLVRMRTSARTLARAGLIANAGAFLALALVLSRILFPVSSAEKPAPTPAAIDAEMAAGSDTPGIALQGITAMFRGDAAHTGVLGGPAPAGEPVLTWRYDAAGEITGSAATANGLVYFTGKRGDLFAVDVQSGDLRWQAHLGDYVSKSTPAIAGNTVVVAGGYALFAFNAATGEQLWKLPVQYAAQSSPTIDGSVAYVASQTGRVYAVDIASGAQIWSYNAEAVIFSAPAVSGPYLYVGTDSGVVHALRIDRGTAVWKTQVGGNIFASPAVIDGKVIVEGRGQAVVALSADEGTEVWRYGISGQSSVAISDGLVIAGSDDGGIHAIDLATGQPAWLFPTGSPVLSSPVIVGSTIFAASGLNLYAINLTDGAGLWRFSTTDTIEASPAIANGQIYLGSRDGFLYAISGSG
jgi:outer membrane protein assembly factor BamB